MQTANVSAQALLTEYTFKADCVIETVRGTAARTGALQVGHKIVNISGQHVSTRAELRSALGDHQSSNGNVVVGFVAGDEGSPRNSRATASGSSSPSAGARSRLAQAVSYGNQQCVLRDVSPSRQEEIDAHVQEEKQRRPDRSSSGSRSANPPPRARALSISSLATSALPNRADWGPVLSMSWQGSTAANESFAAAIGASNPLAAKLEDRLRSTPRGMPIIIIGDASFNPIDDINFAARTRGLPPPRALDFGVKLRHRVKPPQLAEHCSQALTKGFWVVLQRATRSIALLSELPALLAGINPSSIHENGQIIIVAEPHPHFPNELINGKSKPIGVVSADISTTQLSFTSFSTSITAQRYTLTGARDGGNVRFASPAGAAPVVFASPAMSSIIPPASDPTGLTGDPSGGLDDTRRRVRLTSVLSVVDIEPREGTMEALLGKTNTDTGSTRLQVTKEDGSVICTGEFNGVMGDKFYGVTFANREKDLVGCVSALGHLYLVDLFGASVASYHVHDSAVWAVDFLGESQFVTGAEDETCCYWEDVAVRNDEGSGLGASTTSKANTNPVGKPVPVTDLTGGQASNVARGIMRQGSLRCPKDIYSAVVTGNRQAVAVGGLYNSVMLCPFDTGASETAPGGRRGGFGENDRRATTLKLPTSVQSMAPIGIGAAVGVGCVDGSVGLLDTRSAAVVSTVQPHTQKVAALAAVGDTIVSGSYDSKIRLWDTRAKARQSLQVLRFDNFVTGIAADGHYAAASVGSSLYVLDLRNMSSILGGKLNAWPGISRGICMDGVRRTIVTASPDGTARFWGF